MRGHPPETSYFRKLAGCFHEHGDNRLKMTRLSSRHLSANPPMRFAQDTSLPGEHTSPPAHHDQLIEAVQDGELWRLWYTTVPSPEGMASEIRRRLAVQLAGSMLPFAVLDASGRAVGMNIDAAKRRMKIGSTWHRKAVQRSALNTECKRLLLTHAFETLAASPSSSAPISSITPADGALKGWVPGSAVSCVSTRSTFIPTRRARCATRASTASWRSNGQPSKRISPINWPASAKVSPCRRPRFSAAELAPSPCRCVDRSRQALDRYHRMRHTHPL